MPTQYGGFPAYELMYDQGGQLLDPQAEADLIAGIPSPPEVADVVLFSHGWNNNEDEARALYAAFFANVRAAANEGRLALKNLVVGAIFWPSKKFTDPTLIPGGAASIGDGPLSLDAQLDAFKAIFVGNQNAEAMVEHARSMIPTLAVSQSAQNDFVASLVSLVPLPRGPEDEGLDEARVALKAIPGSAVLQGLSVPTMPVLPLPMTGGAASLQLGGALSALGNIIGGVQGAATSLLNALTYYTMKDRAGIVGSNGVAQTILALASSRPVARIHLIGHSFGGRVVTAAANALPASGPKLATMMLLEAAYSHYGLAQKWDGTNDGAFRSVVSDRKVKGAISITHSSHDWPVGVAYPVASRIMNQVAAAIGGASDKFGGMGRNGAQATPEAFDDFLLPVGGVYQPLPASKWIRNLNGDGPTPPVIESHGDVTKPEIVHAWISALGTGN